MSNPFLVPSRQHPKAQLGNTLVVDSAGNPQVVYRGEHGNNNGEGLHTKLPSLSFGTENTANLYALQPNNRSDVVHAPRVYPVFLSIQNPVFNDVNDPFIDIAIIEDKLGIEEAVRVAREHEDHVMNTNNWYELSDELGVDSVDELLKKHPERLGDLYLNIYPVLDDPEFIRACRAAGYDGAIHGGSGESALEPEYRIFSPGQAYSVITGAPMPEEKPKPEGFALAV